MAQVNGPLFSVHAHKTFASRLEYSLRRGRNFVRNSQRPTGSASAGQSSVRGFFLEASEKWQLLTGAQKLEWSTYNDS